MYHPDSIPLSPNPEAPVGIHPSSLHQSGEMFGNYAHPETGGAGIRLSDEYARTLNHAYAASVSFADAQAGKVLDELDRLGLTENTIVVVWGDHGWHLGDHTIWGKHSTFERALRSALIIRTPGMAQPGAATDGIVESLDLYPTLAQLAGIDSLPTGLTGASILPLLQDPQHPGKDGAFGYWHGRRSLRTDRYRITLYGEDTDGPCIELYDHETDPHETHNVAEEQPEVVEALLPRLMSRLTVSTPCSIIYPDK